MKLFRTISLEERLKNSIYNDIGPSPEEPVNQGGTTLKKKREEVALNQGGLDLGATKAFEPNHGSIVLKQAIATEGFITAQLKLTPEAPQKNAIVLKTMMASRNVPPLKPIVPLQTTPLVASVRGKAFTAFGAGMSLENRLKQPFFNTTKSLDKYFLSDVHTKFIKIVPFGIFTHTSDLKIKRIETQPNQGTVTVIYPNIDSLLLQGTYYDRILEKYISFIVTTKPIREILIRQGTFFQNGQYISQTQIIPSTDPRLLQQGGVFPENAVDQRTIEFRMGLFIDERTLELVSPTEPADPTTAADVEKRINKRHGKIIIQNEKFQSTIIPDQGGENPVPVTFTPEIKSPILRLLGYEIDRLLAFLSPIAKHGVQEPRDIKFGSKIIKQGEAPPNLGMMQPSILTKEVGPLLKGLLSSKQADNVLLTYIDWQYAFVGTKDGVSFVNNQVNPNRRITLLLGLDTADIQQIGNYIESTVSFPPAANGASSLGTYKTLTYGAISKKAKTGQVTSPSPKVTGGLLKGVSDVNNGNDFVTLKIASLTGGGSVQFRAYISSISDSYSINWNDVNYIGRQDTMKTFKGVTRSLSLAWKVAAMTKADLSAMYVKLASLANIVAIGKSGGNYLIGPVAAITVGRWFRNTPCAVSSLKFDTQPAEYSWDIDTQMPHIIDVSMDMAILGDNTGAPLKSPGSKIFGL